MVSKILTYRSPLTWHGLLCNMNWDIMGAWFLFNVMVCVAAVSFAIFLNTKAGKKWKKNL